jgi:hypothetical protein
MTHKIGYLELKQAIESTKEAMESSEISLQINQIALKALETELAKYPAPKLEDKKE